MLALRDDILKKMYVVYPHLKLEPGISEIYFLSCWFYKTINRHHVSLCQSPCWTMAVLFTWKRKLAWAAAFINFPFLFSPTTCLSWHGEGPFWAQQVVLCAWHHLKLVQVSGGLFAALPVRMFADPKKQLFSLAFHVCDKHCFPRFAFFHREKHSLKVAHKSYKINMLFMWKCDSFCASVPNKFLESQSPYTMYIYIYIALLQQHNRPDSLVMHLSVN